MIKKRVEANAQKKLNRKWSIENHLVGSGILEYGQWS